MSEDNLHVNESNNSENSYHINIRPHFTHRFIYKNKEFDINLFLLSSCSDYFESNFNKFKNSETICFEGNEDDLDMSDYIQTFFDICHFSDIKLTDENVLPLHYICCIFNAKSIKEKIQQYINENHSRLAIRILQFNQQNRKCKLEIKMISNNKF